MTEDPINEEKPHALFFVFRVKLGIADKEYGLFCNLFFLMQHVSS